MTIEQKALTFQSAKSRVLVRRAELGKKIGDHSYVSNGGFGVDFPESCPEGRGPMGMDAHTFGLALRAEIPDVGLLERTGFPYLSSAERSGVAAGWAGQLVCYPIYADMREYGPQPFHAYSNGYVSRWASGTWPVGVMCLTWAILLWVPVRNVPRGLVWSIVALCVAFAAVTPPAAIAQDHMFAEGFSNDLYGRLMLWNGFRTAIFTLIGVLAIVVMRRRLMFTETQGA